MKQNCELFLIIICVACDQLISRVFSMNAFPKNTENSAYLVNAQLEDAEVFKRQMFDLESATREDGDFNIEDSRVISFTNDFYFANCLVLFSAFFSSMFVACLGFFGDGGFDSRFRSFLVFIGLTIILCVMGYVNNMLKMYYRVNILSSSILFMIGLMSGLLLGWFSLVFSTFALCWIPLSMAAVFGFMYIFQVLNNKAVVSNMSHLLYIQLGSVLIVSCLTLGFSSGFGAGKSLLVLISGGAVVCISQASFLQLMNCLEWNTAGDLHSLASMLPKEVIKNLNLNSAAQSDRDILMNEDVDHIPKDISFIQELQVANTCTQHLDVHIAFEKTYYTDSAFVVAEVNLVLWAFLKFLQGLFNSGKDVFAKYQTLRDETEDVSSFQPNANPTT
eukprot:GDKJ01049667.1.p1 GENE.GDKJ01049667.1~~GDKJ01049667.1.p1  ORF type:complete len:390 (-),score=51.58 GDKJ01049667.1:198-1367(-)